MRLVDASQVSISLAVLGFYVCVVGIVSYILKQRLFVASSLVALLLGIAVGPQGWGWVDPLRWTDGNVESRNELSYEIYRVVIGIQVLVTGIELPKAYLWHARRSLFILLIPIMTMAWFISAGLIKALVPGLTFLEALCIAACITPTDPVLAASVVKGRFAEKYVRPAVRDLISAESGANDGMGFPFLYLALFLLKRQGESWSVGDAIGQWFLYTWLYQILLSCAIGGVIGFLARRSLKYAEAQDWIEDESFLAYGLGLTFLVLGIVGMIASDDLLAAFIVGNSLTWDDWFRIKTEDAHFQAVLDNFIDAAVFLYIGALIPFTDMQNAAINLNAGKLVALAILILLVRRLPAMLLFKPLLNELATWREAVFVGWFGPMGVGAAYYAMAALREIPEERTQLREVITPIVFIIILGSVVVHGVTIPVAKLGVQGVRITRTRSSRPHTPRGSRPASPTLGKVTGQDNEAENRAERGEATSNHEPQREGETAYIEGSHVIIEDANERTRVVRMKSAQRD